MQKAKLHMNTLKDIEETKIRLMLKEKQLNLYRLALLINFRPNTSLRAINNQAKLNIGV